METHLGIHASVRFVKNVNKLLAISLQVGFLFGGCQIGLTHDDCIEKGELLYEGQCHDLDSLNVIEQQTSVGGFMKEHEGEFANRMEATIEIEKRINAVYLQQYKDAQ